MLFENSNLNKKTIIQKMADRSLLIRFLEILEELHDLECFTVNFETILRYLFSENGILSTKLPFY